MQKNSRRWKKPARTATSPLQLCQQQVILKDFPTIKLNNRLGRCQVAGTQSSFVVSIHLSRIFDLLFLGNNYPIIMISSSPTALITMHNVKRFLQESTCVSAPQPSSQTTLILSNLASSSRKMLEHAPLLRAIHDPKTWSPYTVNALILTPAVKRPRHTHVTTLLIASRHYQNLEPTHGIEWSVWWPQGKHGNSALTNGTNQFSFSIMVCGECLVIKGNFECFSSQRHLCLMGEWPTKRKNKGLERHGAQGQSVFSIDL